MVDVSRTLVQLLRCALDATEVEPLQPPVIVLHGLKRVRIDAVVFIIHAVWQSAVVMPFCWSCCSSCICWCLIAALDRSRSAMVLTPLCAGLQATTCHVQEREGESDGLQLRCEDVDAVLVARLIEEPPAEYPLPPVPYLLGCYQRACSLPPSAPGGEQLVNAVKDAVLNYLWLCLGEAGIVPQPAAQEQRGSAQLFDALWAAVPHGTGTASTAQAGPVALPPGLLAHALRTKGDEVTPVLGTIMRELAMHCRSTSILGDVHALDCCWFKLVETKELAAAVMSHPVMCPSPVVSGSAFQQSSPLAALLGITFLPHPGPEPKPSVLAEVLLPMDERSASGLAAVTTPSTQHVNALQQLFSPKALLCKGARPHTIAWIEAALASERERKKTYMDHKMALSDGFMHNLTLVLLHLCSPFLDFYSGKAAQFIDCKCAPGQTASVHALATDRPTA